MREPLYRAKAINRPPKGTYRTDYENGDWVYGLVSKLWNYHDEQFAEMTNTDGVEGIDVDPKTICEYTGLTDSYDNKIFEGDIVKITDELVNGVYYARVEFGNPNAQYNWGFQLVTLCDTPFAIDILHWVDMEESGAFIEVIGNIYDNPELLK
ncbi:MAG: YopX family protein, partial [Clostridiales bacterium]|nr:YopX family protein [Clostridiales bacterium]